MCNCAAVGTSCEVWNVTNWRHKDQVRESDSSIVKDFRLAAGTTLVPKSRDITIWLVALYSDLQRHKPSSLPIAENEAEPIVRVVSNSCADDSYSKRGNIGGSLG